MQYSVINSSNTQPHPTRKTVALPKIELQTFSGNVLEWASFFDIFKSSIHSDTTLDNIQKFVYLRSMLKDEAARTVGGLTLTDANYSHAIELLEERYGQKHQIIDAHMTALWNLSKPVDDANSLRHFYDSLESHVRGLQSLGKDELTYGELLVPMIREKLPPSIRKQIARDHGSSAWTLPDLRKAILREIDTLQAGKPIDGLFTMNDTLQPELTAAFHTTAQSTKKRPQTCPFCKGTHFASNCTIITDTRKRLDIVKKDRLCFNCFGKHRVSECKSKYSCRVCKKRHHTALHYDANKPERSSTSSTTTSEITVTLTKANPLLNKKTAIGPVLLKTALVPISAGNGNPIRAVVLFDEGANMTFTTEKFARELSAKTTRREHIKLSTFGDKTSNVRAMAFTELTAHELNGNTSTIDAMIIPEISSDLTNHISQEIHNMSHLKGLHFAHPVSDDEKLPIDILIGADQYWNYVGSQVISGMVGPTAVSSKFGYLLSGPSGTTNTVDSNVRMLHVISTPDNYVTKNTIVTENGREIVDNVDIQYTSRGDDAKVQNVWDLELIGIKESPETDKRMSYESYKDTHLRVDQGKYVARLPWKEDHPPLPTNYSVTVNRTRNMIRRLTPDVIKKYDDIIAEQRRRDFIEEVNEDDTSIGHYLPHRAIKKDSATTPIRIVYDCSCSQGASFPNLNDCLQTGPSLINLPDLPAILLRFRSNNIALTSDIEKAFLNVRLEEDERKFTKFLWLLDASDPE
ncbi:uncharacterized protein LOC102808861, partial [Saccoglossus kowalevskii]|uniref:Uncharacterized protein LOC102808861 n=1 Tax=Saccoglossus kowalevskii TaxID=10224 RepID=A0ABM0N0B0_SACKO